MAPDAQPTPGASPALPVLLSLGGRTGRDLDPVAASDALSRAARMYPGPWEATWSHCLTQAGGDFGLRCSTLECSPEEAVGLAAAGRTLVGFAKGEGVILLGPGKEGGAVLQAPGAGPERPASIPSLAAALGVEPATRIKGWLICFHAFPAEGLSRPTGPGDHAGTGGYLHPETTPWSRLVGFLKPEAPLIRSLVVYSLVVGLFTLAVPLAVDALISAVAFGGFLQPVVVLSAVLLGALLLSGAFRGIQAYLAEVIQRRLFLRLASDLAFRLPRVRMEAHDRHYGPELVNRFFDVAIVQKNSALILLEGVNVVLGAVIGMGVLAFYHPLLLTFDLVLIAAVSLIVFGPARRAVRSAVNESRVKYQVAGWLEDLARNPVAFMSPGGRRLALDRLDRLASDWLAARKAHFRALLLQICGGLGLQAVAATALLALGGVLVIEGTLTLGQLVAAELIVSAVVASIAKLGKYLEGGYDMLAAVEKLGHLTDLPLEEGRGGAPVPAGRAGGLSLRAESLSYGFLPGHPVIDGLSFEIPPRSRTALVGPAGAGASTLLQLLYALRRPSAGRLAFDGFDLHEWHPDALRSQVALVGRPEIIEGSLLENVRFGRPEIDVAEIRASLEAAGLWDSVRRLPEGIHTRLSAWGDPLSATQCGLLMIARALAGRPRLLLLDGVLDGLDESRRGEVADRLFGGDRDMTLVIKTKIPDLIRRCDRVIELQPAGRREAIHGT
jgi:putative ABC transport system ATP-binding protein